ncbi:MULTISPECIES: YbaB/EbfC family nucleoid-associated protein [unclassified Micromonospora]|uniref:YbaB/EbfC family nucleoid-associated protein n=1 Tax=unclassified Micromonospora TaxID=2617518 RepID=UPI001C24A2D3|nr:MULTISPECIES: YbaB/EbfC family nucleoid-associated protein [unclassified Micromonospora]MBU8861096.1 YbaB/EbfC family nucleoid-associated protein [Micromonospora sp. WMMB482]MDM4780644.1 YbaB/EbfC family nucleoid-associated protein [Micromonospora sp. b486]
MTNDPFSAAASLDELLTRTQQALAAMRSRASAHTDGEPGDLLRAEGTAAGGRVRAVAVQGGRLDSVVIDPELAGVPFDVLCGHLVTAANAALSELDAQVSASARADADALAARLGGVGDQAELFSRAMHEVAARIHRDRGAVSRAGRPAGAGTHPGNRDLR